MLDYTSTSIIERELLLAKISILGPEYAQEQLLGPTHSDSFDHAVMEQNPRDAVQPLTSTEGEQTSTQNTDKAAREQAMARSFEAAGGPTKASDPSPLYPNRQPGMTASEALIAKNLHLSAIKTLSEGFGGRVVDVAENSCIVEMTAKSSRVEAFLSLIKPFGILEAARSGMSRVYFMHWKSWSPVAISKLTNRCHGSPSYARRPVHRRRGGFAGSRRARRLDASSRIVAMNE